MPFASRAAAAICLSAASLSAFAQQGETVKIAFIDPLSGLMASTGIDELHAAQFLAEHFNQHNAAGVKFEIVSFDNNLSPQETTTALQSAINQGIRYVMQANGSGPALALIEALNKYNARNPGKEVLYFNYGGIDPVLTNSKCSFWHYRYDADVFAKMNALTDYMKEQPGIKKVYLFNQNTSFGRQVSQSARDYLKQKRPDIQIVGEDFVPLAQVRDFSPYVAKIKASGVDTVITGNWGTDLTLLVKAATDVGLNANFYTYYATSVGSPTAFGAPAAGKVFEVFYSYYDMPGLQKLDNEFQAKFDADLFLPAAYNIFASLAEGIAKAKSTNAAKVAFAMEDLKFTGFNGEVQLRKTDHQLQQSLYILRWEKASAKYPYSVEKTGYTLAPVKSFDAAQTSMPTTCQMKRPAG